MKLTNPQDGGGFDDLASGSLSTWGSNPLQPSWSRSLSELMAESQALLGGNHQQPTAAAQRLLGNRSDIGSLTAASMETLKPSKLEAFSSVEANCRKHRDRILESILQKEREQTQRSLEQAIERQLEEDWSKERNWWMKEIVGTRNLVDAANTLTLRDAKDSSQLAGTTLQALPFQPQNLFQNSYPSTMKRLDPKFVNEHLDLVKTMNSSTDLSHISKTLESLASSYSTGYTTAWKLFSYMIPRLPSPVNGALGALVHLCRQYQTFVRRRVSAANVAAQDISLHLNYRSSMAECIAAYVKLEHGRESSIWKSLYFCLRCGDAVAAMDILNVASSTQENFQEEPLIRSVISQLCQGQGRDSCIWERDIPLISSRDRAAIADWYERAKSLEPDSVQKIGVLALLSGNSLSTFDTIEDYVFGRLWLAVQHEDAISEVAKIGESIRARGPAYYNADETCGWGYALPLLLTQQFETALTYLAVAGGPAGLLEAVHLALVFSTNRNPINDLGRRAPSESVVTLLLVRYAQLLEADPTFGVSRALEYLLQIPDKDTARREIAALVCRSIDRLDWLAGGLNEDGSRGVGELDKHLRSKNEVSMILAEAGETFRTQKQDPSKAELSLMLFMRAGHFRSLMKLLNELITPVDQDDENSSYWWEQSLKFHDNYLSKRTLVLATLENDNDLDLKLLNETLMKLRRFFLLLRSDHYQEGLEMLSDLGLLPMSQEEMNDKELQFKSLDDVLKNQFPALLRGTVHCLFGLYRQVKSESHGGDQVVEERLKELQKRARMLYIFSGLTNMPMTTKEDIARLRNNMI